jgi:hypothetical protein
MTQRRPSARFVENGSGGIATRIDGRPADRYHVTRTGKVAAGCALLFSDGRRGPVGI